MEKLKSVCQYCGKDLKNKHSTAKYCNNQCQNKYQQMQYINRWKQGLETGLRGTDQLSAHVKTYLLERANYKCELCGWGKLNLYTQTIPLDIHHIDGNYKNNNESNLQVLCPNCHALTENYKGANKGNGRNTK